jgi:hypothetical protein
MSYNHAPVDTHHKVEPRLNLELERGIAQHLKAEGAMALLVGRRVAVQARNEAIEGVEHLGVACEQVIGFVGTFSNLDFELGARYAKLPPRVIGRSVWPYAHGPVPSFKPQG